MKYRKKPVVIDAFHVGSGNDVPEWLLAGLQSGEVVQAVGVVHPGNPNAYEIHTLEGRMITQHGDWIIQGVKGELYPCKPDIFEATYEKVED